MTDSVLDTPLTRDLGIQVPIIGGAMYPCSNPELVAAVSAAGGIGVLQPVSLTYVFGHEFREGVRMIRRLAGGKPVGMNALIERSSRKYHERMVQWVNVALEEGVTFFVTSLGNPRWVVEAAHRAGARVYHDVTERKWALKGLEAGVDGLIAVNRDAGGHPGGLDPEPLLEELSDLGVPVVGAGGVGTPEDFVRMLRIGYAGVQMGTRFIATPECQASGPYKTAVVDAGADDIVWTDRISGVPVAVIRTPYIERTGTRAGPLARRLLRGHRTKHWMRTFYALRALWQLKRTSLDPAGAREYWQAGKSVEGIDSVEPVASIIHRFTEAAGRETGARRPDG
jgi:nitronate monooxygenase